MRHSPCQLKNDANLGNVPRVTFSVPGGRTVAAALPAVLPVVGPSGSGKTVLAMQIASELSTSGTPVAYVSDVYQEAADVPCVLAGAGCYFVSSRAPTHVAAALAEVNRTLSGGGCVVLDEAVVLASPAVLQLAHTNENVRIVVCTERLQDFVSLAGDVAYQTPMALMSASDSRPVAVDLIARFGFGASYLRARDSGPAGEYAFYLVRPNRWDVVAAD